MTKARIELGRSAEDAAALFLKKQGYSILARNYRNRAGELDIIARDGAVICFVEVKARLTNECGRPCEAVNSLKRRRISRIAVMFLQEKGLLDRQARFDVVAITGPGPSQAVELIKDAFALEGSFTF